MSGLTIIVAATTSNGIGVNSRLPWRLSKELKYFSQVTSKAPDGQRNAVIMGRGTWESIPEKRRPLQDRLNIVISHDPKYDLRILNESSALLKGSLASAIGETTSPNAIHRQFIIGGASLYSESLAMQEASSSRVDRVLLTRILSPDFECDVFMPDFTLEKRENGQSKWNRASHDSLQEWVGFEVPKEVQKENGVEYEFQMWVCV